jgi:hypothetical protein
MNTLSLQIKIYDTFDDLIMSCDENEIPPTDGCLAFVRDTQFIYVQMPGDDCDWQAWVSERAEYMCSAIDTTFSQRVLQTHNADALCTHSLS